jgi:hypothetical protein
LSRLSTVKLTISPLIVLSNLKEVSLCPFAEAKKKKEKKNMNTGFFI